MYAHVPELFNEFGVVDSVKTSFYYHLQVIIRVITTL